MRLGGPVYNVTDPDSWVAALQASGYRASFCPVGVDATDDDVARYARAAAQHDIVIAEVGVWNNPLSPDEEQRKAAVITCERCLDLADRIGARCCVNLAGSRGERWLGPDARDLTLETFDMVVESVRAIIDAVKPKRSFYTLETMEWMYPDSPNAYLRLLKAIDRPRFAVHLDPTNLVCSPQIYFRNARMIREAFRKLGPYVRSCHAKDILLGPNLTVHLDEVRIGLGQLDYVTYLKELSVLDPDTPLMLEHLPNEAEYKLAAGHLRSVAERIGVAL